MKLGRWFQTLGVILSLAVIAGVYFKFGPDRPGEDSTPAPTVDACCAAKPAQDSPKKLDACCAAKQKAVHGEKLDACCAKTEAKNSATAGTEGSQENEATFPTGGYQEGEMCQTHRVPEAECAICNPAAITQLAAQGQWAKLRLSSEDSAEKAGLRTELVRSWVLTVTAPAQARIDYNRNRLTCVTSRVSGVIASVSSDLGDEVHAGELLAELDSPQLGEAKNEYFSALKTYELARAEFQRQQKVTTNVKTLLAMLASATSIAAIQAQSGPLMIGAQKAQLLGAYTAFNLAQETLPSLEKASQQGLLPVKDWVAARKEFETATAEYQGLRETLAVENETQLLSADKKLQETSTSVQVAERKLRLLGVNDQELADLTAHNGQGLTRHAVVAPIAGTVVAREAVAGEAVSSEATLFQVADLSSVWVWLEIPEARQGAVKVGQTVSLTVDGLAEPSFQGLITWVGPEVDRQTRTVRARAQLPNPEGKLKAGMFGAAKITIDVKLEATLMPQIAVLDTKQGPLAFVQRLPDLFETHPVLLGDTEDGWTEVLSGLQPGDPVVTQGAFLLKTEIMKSDIGAGCCPGEE